MTYYDKFVTIAMKLKTELSAFNPYMSDEPKLNFPYISIEDGGLKKSNWCETQGIQFKIFIYADRRYKCSQMFSQIVTILKDVDFVIMTLDIETFTSSILRLDDNLYELVFKIKES